MAKKKKKVAKKKAAKKVAKKSAPKKAAKKKVAKKATAKKSAPKKVAKKATAKKAAPKKVAKKVTAKKSAPKKVAAKKVAKKAAPKKAVKKVEPKKAAKKTAPEKKAAPKKEIKVAAKATKKTAAPKKAKKAAKKVTLEASQINIIREEIVITDAEGRRLCKVTDCDQPAVVDTHCRYHYLLFWKKIQVRKKILSEGKLGKYIEELTSRYPPKFLEQIKKDLRSESEFLSAVAELEIDENLSNDDSMVDDDRSFIEEVRGVTSRDSDQDQDSY